MQKKRSKRRKKRNPFLIRKINSRMSVKLVGLFGAVVLALVALSIRITYINASEGNQYKKQVLSQSQQKYESRVIPFKRGDILDRNGAVLATSEKVYKIILDCKVVNSKEDYIEPTIKAMVEILGIDEAVIREKLENENTKSSQYQIMKTNVPITTKKEFEQYTDVTSEEAKQTLTAEERSERSKIKGVWFEENYLRTYPLGSVACDLIGFTYTGDTADWGIEGYYSSTLNGVNGRQYGYFNSDADVEQTIIEPENGNSVISTIDVNIQQIVEKHIQTLMDALMYGPNGDKGAENIGVIVADPNNGDILAMASSDPYNLNSPRELENFYSAEEIAAMDNDEMLNALYGIWKNYCISDAFEPGSTVKPLTVAGALQSNSILSSDTFECDGYQMFGDTRIRCAVYPGAHGTETLSDLIADSCNDGLMQIGAQMGAQEFLKYQKIFNFGSSTGIDLPGEASGLIHSESALSKQSTELACAAFGQGYTCTMLQEIMAICSVINGGYYYQPRVVDKVLDENGSVVKTMEPVVSRQTISSDVSALIRQYMGAVCEKGGTGYGAKVDGYSMGGKTGTAEKIPRGEGNYLVSYIGFAPLDDPQVLIYVIVDEPNVESQADSSYAQYIAQAVLDEILPYMNIYPDEQTEEATQLWAGFKGIPRLDQTEAEIREEEEAEGSEIGAENPDMPEPPKDENQEETEYTNEESDGITNEEAGYEDSGEEETTEE